MDADATGPEAALPSSPFADSMDRDVRRDAVMRRLFPQADALPQQRVGRFALLRVVGQGGMGRVYAAYDEQLDRRVAVKLLRHQPDARSRERSLREAQAMAKIDDPNVLSVFEVGEHGEHLYIAMEFVDGQSLDRWQAEDRGWADVLDVYRQAGRGLAAAHAAGLVHRDFKPHNVMVSATDEGRWRARVLDFGLALAPADGSSITGSPSSSGSDLRLTTTGDLLGTPVYMPLEQLEGRDVGPRADQFAFCVSVWEGLFGARPFEEGTIEAMRRSRRDGPGPVDRGALLLGGVALGQSSTDTPSPCADVEAALDGTWSQQRRDAIQTSLSAVEGLGPRAWAYASPRLEAYAAAWVDGQRDTCRRKVAGEQSDAIITARARCFDAARREFDATTALLASADPEIAARTSTLVDALPNLEVCNDLQRLQVDIAEPSPDQRETVQALDEALASARTRFLAGAHDEVEPELASIVSSAEALGYAPLRVRANLLLGRVLLEQGEHDPAQAALEHAMRTGVSTNQWREAFDAAVFLIRLETLRERFDASEAWATTAQAMHGRAASVETTQQLEAALGWAANNANRHAEAAAHLERALEAAEQRDTPMAEARVLSELCEVNWQLGKHALAIEQQRASLATFEAELGPEHPSTAFLANKLAIYLGALGELEEALPLSEPTLAVMERAWAPTSQRVLGAKKNHLQLLRASGRLEEAEALAREVVEGMAELWGPAHSETLMAEAELGLVLASAERYDEGEPLLRRMGRPEAARAEYEDLLERMPESLGPEHPLLLDTRSAYAQVLQQLGELEQARAQYVALLGLGDEQAVTRVGYATLLAKLGEHDAAAEQLRDAWTRYGDLDTDDPADIAKAAYVMARIQVELGNDAAVATWTERAEAAHARAKSADNQVEALDELAAELEQATR